jgi:hypothetical protein
VIYHCCTETRRALIRAQAALNGIDFLEVVDDPAQPLADRQRTLRIRFVNAPAPSGITPANVEITGGVRVVGITATSVAYAANVLVVQVSRAGDFSPYTLRLINTDGTTLTGLDPLSAAVTFSFKVECPSEFDCAPACECPPEERAEPEIDYTAKDYASFRRLMLDRMALTIPQWTERNPADLGIALVELLAYVGDQLSYRQDAIATEAYLGTARHRASVRRHARLVDYAMHDGCNARTWLHVRLKTSAPKPLFLKKGTRVVIATPGQLAVVPADVWDQLQGRDPLTFETMADIVLAKERNELSFYTFGDDRCSLPRGSTRAALRGDNALIGLKPGAVLVFVEKIGPTTGERADANPEHRQAVRLTCATPLVDALNGNTKYIDIEWGEEDALAFPLCLSAVANGLPVADVSVALGNIVLADHGRTLPEESLRPVPKGIPAGALPPGCDPCDPPDPTPRPPRYRPTLARGSITQAASFVNSGPAARAGLFEWKDVKPAVRLRDKDGTDWFPQRDLLDSEDFAREFVVEIDTNGRAGLRFGDDVNGRSPAPETVFKATYRTGTGTAGNVAAGTLRHLAPPPGPDEASAPADPIEWGWAAVVLRVERAENALPARGGTDPESIEQVRQSAPFAYQIAERAVTEADYARVAERHPQVLRAVAQFRWTGSWRTVFVTVQRRAGRAFDAGFRKSVERHIDRFRMAGQDVVVRPPLRAPLEVSLSVCVEPSALRAHVGADIFERLGTRGLFAPDRFTFDQPVYLSHLLAAAASVPGVRHLQVLKFQRLGRAETDGRASGQIDIGANEIATLDNDPNFPERGLLRLTLEGGR